MSEEADRRRNARRGFIRLIAYTAVAAVLMVAGALAYLSLYGTLTPTMIIATSLGVFLSVMLGAGLMAMGFLSSNSGHDDRAAGRRTEK